MPNNDMIFNYPRTDLHSVNLDYILKIVRENAGLHLEVSGNQLLMKTADNTIISAITIPYATEAGSANTASSASYASTAGSAASAQYAATAGTATTATNATNAAHATTADTATTATSATTAATATNATNAAHATTADSATTAASANYAETTGSVEHAEKAFETVGTNGDFLAFTTYDDTTSLIKAPFAAKAQKDDLNNIIKSTYVANVVDDNGVLKFNDAQGNTIVSLTPTIANAAGDSYGNTIADYIKTIAVSSNSNYVTVTHGTGTADTLTIHYSETAWKDTNGNVIKNTYIKRLEIVTDPNDGHKKLVAYNGDDPEAELFRFEIEAYSAQIAAEASHAAYADYATSAGTAAEAVHATTADSDPNGNTIESYTKSFSSNSSTYGIQHLVAKDGEGNVVSDINLFDRSQIVIGFFDKDKTNPDDIDSLTVGQQVTYTVDPDVLGWYKFSGVDEMLTAGAIIGYINTSDQMIQRIVVQYNRYYFISCFDYTANTIKTFMVGQGTLPTDIDVRRMS